MRDSSIEQRKVILFILCLLLGALSLGAIKQYYPQTATKIIYINPHKSSSNHSSSEIKPAEQAEFVFINNASVEQLTQLSGIGNVIGQRIIDYRQDNGPFKTKEELLRIKGIGPKKLQNIKDLIRLK